MGSNSQESGVSLHKNGEAQDLSDCESGTSMTDAKEQELHFPGTGFAKLQCFEPVYRAMADKFVSQISSCGYDAEVEFIYRNKFSTAMSEAKLKSFLVYSKALERKCGGSANEVYAWYGASMAEIRDVLGHGFCSPDKNLVYGHGIHLSPAKKPLNSLLSATPEASGLKCLLLCRVILGKTEVVSPCSRQWNPSSVEFDSGVDSASSPATYVVWSSRMNTHILPEVAVVFRASRAAFSHGSRRTSEWMPFSTLIRTLSKFLPRDAIKQIGKVHSDYKKKKMSRSEMVERVRNIAGNRLLLEIVKSYRGKSTLLRCF